MFSSLLCPVFLSTSLSLSVWNGLFFPLLLSLPLPPLCSIHFYLFFFLFPLSASRPKWDDVLKNTGEIPSVHMSACSI